MAGDRSQRVSAFDPLLSIEPGAQAGLRGWAVAAAIIARLQEVGLSGGIDVPAILGPAIPDLGEPELEELARNYGRLWILRDAFLNTRQTGSLSTSAAKAICLLWVPRAPNRSSRSSRAW
jgi:hypothetical protein